MIPLGFFKFFSACHFQCGHNQARVWFNLFASIHVHICPLRQSFTFNMVRKKKVHGGGIIWSKDRGAPKWVMDKTLGDYSFHRYCCDTSEQKFWSAGNRGWCRKLGYANSVEICELSHEVCFIAIGFKQTTWGLLGGQLNLKNKQKKKSLAQLTNHSI